MSKKKTKELMAYAIKPGMSEIEKLKAQLNMAIGLILKQKMMLACLRARSKSKSSMHDACSDMEDHCEQESTKKPRLFPHRDI